MRPAPLRLVLLKGCLLLMPFSYAPQHGPQRSLSSHHQLASTSRPPALCAPSAGDVHQRPQQAARTVMSLQLSCAGAATEEWVQRYNGPSNEDDRVRFLAVDRTGNIYVTGVSVSTGRNYDYTTLKYAANGVLLWEKRYNGPGHGDDIPRSLAVDGAGNVYVTGGSAGTGSSRDYATLKYAANGDLLWEQRYNGPDNSVDDATALAVDRIGNVYVTGGSAGTGSSIDYATLKYAPNGELLWVQRYNGPDNDIDAAQALAVDGGGNVYVTGNSETDGNPDYVTLKYATNGKLLWKQQYNGSGNDVDAPRSLAVDRAGNVWVTGTSVGKGGNADYATLRYAANGNLLWEQRYNGPGNNLDDATALAVDGIGNVYVTGLSRGKGGNADYATLKYAANGNLLWVQCYNGPGNGNNGDDYDYDEARSLAVDGASNVYVTGLSASNGVTCDYATLKYDATGNLLWEKRYNGPGNGVDAARYLAVDGLGNVYVAGDSEGEGSGLDYALVKY